MLFLLSRSLILTLFQDSAQLIRTIHVGVMHEKKTKSELQS